MVRYINNSKAFLLKLYNLEGNNCWSFISRFRDKSKNTRDRIEALKSALYFYRQANKILREYRIIRSIDRKYKGRQIGFDN